MQKKFYIPNLVVNELGDGVVKQILDKTFKPIVENKILYVSNTGNDTTADGSREKPFRTLNACNLYAQKYIIGNYPVIINFLTDYTETLDRLKLRNNNILNYYTIDGAGHNVVLKGLNLYQGFFILRNLTFNQTNGNAIYTSEYAFTFIGNITINNNSSVNNSLIYANRGSYIAMLKDTTLNLNVTENITASLFDALLNSTMTIDDGAVVNINDRATKCTLYTARNGGYILINPKTFKCPKNRSQAKSYICVQQSHISFANRGAELAIGSLKEIDASSSIS